MKKCSVVFLPLAKIDIREAAYYYRSISPGLGKRFRLKLRYQTEKLMRWPESGGKRYDNIRFASLRTFPYAMHYFYDDNKHTVYVTAVFSKYTNPNKGPERNSE